MLSANYTKKHFAVNKFIHAVFTPAKPSSPRNARLKGEPYAPLCAFLEKAAFPAWGENKLMKSAWTIPHLWYYKYWIQQLKKNMYGPEPIY
jgi:hypothetical protein